MSKTKNLRLCLIQLKEQRAASNLLECNHAPRTGILLVTKLPLIGTAIFEDWN